MITTIARKEFIEMFRDGRFRWAAFIVLALLAVALVAGGYYQRELVAQQRAAQAAEQARWYAQDPKNPHAAAHYGLYAFKPRLAPAFLDPGVEPYTGVAVWLEAHKQNEMLFRPGEDATLAQRFGDLTVALVLQIVLPLVIILVAFNAFAGERERGTLRQLLSLGLRPRDLVLGKMLGLGGALALMAAPAVLLGIATLALTGPAEGAPRFALLVFIYLLYLGIFLLLALAVSARAPSSRFALVFLIGFWGVNCLLAPRGVSDFAAALYPLPEPISFKARLQEALADPAEVSAMLKERTTGLLKQYAVARTEDLPVNLAGVSLQVGEDHGYQVFDRFYGELFAPMEAQNRFVQRSAALFPMLGVQAISMGLAGTDLAQHRDFIRAAEAHRRAEIKIINDDILAHPVKSGEVLRAATDAATAERSKLLGAFYEDHPELATATGATGDFVTLQLVTNQRIEHDLAPVLSRYQDQLAIQQALVDNLQFLSPALLAQTALADSAGTGLSRYHWFFAQALAHHAELRAFFDPLVLGKEKFAAWDKVPAFRFVEEPITNVAVRVGPALAALALATLGLGLWSWRTLARGASDG